MIGAGVDIHRRIVRFTVGLMCSGCEIEGHVQKVYGFPIGLNSNGKTKIVLEYFDELFANPVCLGTREVFDACKAIISMEANAGLLEIYPQFIKDIQPNELTNLSTVCQS